MQRIGELPFDGGFRDVQVDGRSQQEISYHIMLLHQAGLIDATDLTTLDGVCWRPKCLTYAGNEFLDAAESDTVWNDAKSSLLTGAKTVTLEGLKIALPIALKRLIPGAS
jgi:hypothetical protein